MRRGRGAPRRGVPPPARRRACGPRCRPPSPAAAAARREMVTRVRRDPARRRPRHLLPARRRRLSGERRRDAARPLRHRRSSSSRCSGTLVLPCARAPAASAARARAARRDPAELPRYDPGRERRAEQRARELLRSCVNEEEWAMYRDLGFLRVWGGQAGGPDGGRATCAASPYAYLIYPHKPIVAYLPQTGQLLNEYCVEFPDETRPYGSRAAARLRRRARQVDGAHGRRAAPDRRGQHAPARAARSTRSRSGATSGASAEWERERARGAARAAGQRRRPTARGMTGHGAMTASTSSTAAAPSPRARRAPPRAPT